MPKYQVRSAVDIAKRVSASRSPEDVRLCTAASVSFHAAEHVLSNVESYRSRRCEPEMAPSNGQLSPGSREQQNAEDMKSLCTESGQDMSRTGVHSPQVLVGNEIAKPGSRGCRCQ